jgi:hypothetical protein
LRFGGIFADGVMRRGSILAESACEQSLPKENWRGA